MEQLELSEQPRKKHIKGTAFFLKTKGFLAFGLGRKNGQFLLLKGSSFRLKQATSLAKYKPGTEKSRAKLLDNGAVIFKQGNQNPVFADDQKFKSISHCTSVILGQSRSGEGWMNAEGQTYSEWAKRTIKKVKLIKPKKQKPVLKVGTEVRLKTGERFIISKIISNRDEKDGEFFEYFMTSKAFGTVAGILVPERKVLSNLEEGQA